MTLLAPRPGTKGMATPCASGYPAADARSYLAANAKRKIATSLAEWTGPSAPKARDSDETEGTSEVAQRRRQPH
ncbi:hypothetical protein GCM10025782_20670 [Pedococcus ginsenosidimutans]|uniref:Uncharacterized protein n=1 Tax=Pedococcus ginsenosidimutans TaxID=490570 RepID=A0ABP8Y624_9MICO